MEEFIVPNIFGWDPDGSDAGGQGWYDIACGVSTTNKDEITCGGVNSWKSLDGGATWSLNTHWYGGGAPYVHADLHVVEYISGTTPTAIDNSAFEIVVDCDGTAGWVNVDDMYVSSQNATKGGFLSRN